MAEAKDIHDIQMSEIPQDLRIEQQELSEMYEVDLSTPLNQPDKVVESVDIGVLGQELDLLAENIKVFLGAEDDDGIECNEIFDEVGNLRKEIKSFYEHLQSIEQAYSSNFNLEYDDSEEQQEVNGFVEYYKCSKISKLKDAEDSRQIENQIKWKVESIKSILEVELKKGQKIKEEIEERLEEDIAQLKLEGEQSELKLRDKVQREFSENMKRKQLLQTLDKEIADVDEEIMELRSKLKEVGWADWFVLKFQARELVGRKQSFKRAQRKIDAEYNKPGKDKIGELRAQSKENLSVLKQQEKEKLSLYAGYVAGMDSCARKIEVMSKSILSNDTLSWGRFRRFSAGVSNEVVQKIDEEKNNDDQKDYNISQSTTVETPVAASILDKRSFFQKYKKPMSYGALAGLVIGLGIGFFTGIGAIAVLIVIACVVGGAALGCGTSALMSKFSSSNRTSNPQGEGDVSQELVTFKSGRGPGLFNMPQAPASCIVAARDCGSNSLVSSR